MHALTPNAINIPPTPATAITVNKGTIPTHHTSALHATNKQLTAVYTTTSASVKHVKQTTRSLYQQDNAPYVLLIIAQHTLQTHARVLIVKNNIMPRMVFVFSVKVA